MNLMLGITWARKLTRTQEAMGNLGTETWGGRNGRSTYEPAMLKTMTYETSKYTRTTARSFDNNAKACYNQIIPNLFNLCSKQLGIPYSISNNFTEHLQKFVYSIKTSLGESTQTYQNT